jgi:long-subunit acyl-CoA synthetase (AMP-forming)
MGVLLLMFWINIRKSVNAQLDHHEQLKMVVVIKEEWTIDNGKLTPTMKLKKGAIEDDNATHVQGWYDANQSVVWHD